MAPGFARRLVAAWGLWQDVRAADPGTFLKHYWSSVVQPVRGLDGQVEVYELSVRNLTPVIAQYEVAQARRESPAAEGALAEDQDTPGQRERAAPA